LLPAYCELTAPDLFGKKALSSPPKTQNMIAIPLLIIALAAGVYLLIKATTQYLSPIFKVLSWLVIVLSVGAIFAVLLHGIHHFGYEHRHCHDGLREERIIIKDGSDAKCCPMGGGCKMEGDSVVLEKAMCEKLMGKDSCDKICATRGRCILSTAECTKLCGGESKCMMGGQNSCCMKGAEGSMKECCKKDGETKECCKKK
jgi:hypothetical protein